MEKNKTGKYLKYAIGEVVLVVIGILIALSINNWNGQRVTKKLELNTLEELKTALIQDTVKLDVDLNFFRNKQKRIELLLNHINNKNLITIALIITSELRMRLVITILLIFLHMNY